MATAAEAAAKELARLAVDETGYGVYEDKILKNLFNAEFVARLDDAACAPRACCGSTSRAG